MKPIKVAVLEDEKIFLTELVRGLRTIEFVSVVAYEQTSENFIKKVRETHPEILLLDIYLKDESTTGINVAELFNLPVLFLSSQRKDFLDGIDSLKFKNEFPVEEIGKTFDPIKLNAIFKTFIPRVREFQKGQKVKVKPIGEEEVFITPSDVSFIVSLGKGNHKIYFSNRKPIEIADKTFDYFKQNGFPEEKFYRYDRGCLLNISLTSIEGETLLIPFLGDDGKKREEKHTVSSSKRKEIKSVFLK